MNTLMINIVFNLLLNCLYIYISDATELRTSNFELILMRFVCISN